MEVIKSIFSMQGIISMLLVVAVSLILLTYAKNKGKRSGLNTKDVVAIGIGAALYGVLSMVSLPIGINTSFRLAIAVLVIFGAIFGPVVGFLVGFIGHALNDALMYGSIWWSWAFLSAVIGLFSGIINLEPNCDIQEGKLNKIQIIKMYVYAVVGILAGSLVAYLGDIFLYGEPADKVWLQIILVNVANFAVIAVLGIPAVIVLSKRNNNVGLTKDQ